MNSRFLPLGVVPGKQFSFSLTLVLVQPACTTCVYNLRVQPVCTTCVYNLCVQPVCTTCGYNLHVQPACTTCVYYISMQRRYSVGELYYRNLVTNADHQSKKSGQNQDGQHPGVDQMF